ncbi:MAG: alpha/beta fold hydrolase [Flavobacteriales bacterium]
MPVTSLSLRRTDLSVAAMALTFLLLASCAGAHIPHKTGFTTADSRKIQTYTAGSGPHTIVLESGLGMPGRAWIQSGVFDSLGKDNQVITYNRAGYRPSAQARGPRSLQALSDDLHRVISANAQHEKVLLVGFSLGGSIARCYAIQHPERVKALVLIDPNHEKFAPYAGMSQGHEDTLVHLFRRNKGAAAEAAQLRENVPFMQALPPMPDIPLIVITSVKPGGEMTEEHIRNWVAAHESLGTGVRNFTHIKTAEYGHAVFEENPAMVIELIRSLLK